MEVSYKLIAVLVLAAVGAGAGGCGPAEGTTPAATTTGSMRQRVQARDLLSLLPADSVGAVYMDASAMRDRAWVRELITTVIARQAARRADIRDFLDRTDEFVIGVREIPEGEAHGPLLVLMQGRFVPADMETGDPGAVPGEYRGHALMARPDGGPVSLLLDDHTALWGDRDMVYAALDAVDGLAPAQGPQAAAYRRAAARVGMRSHSFTWVIGMRAILRARGNPIADSPELLAFWADVGDTVEAGAFVTFTDPSVASIYLQAVDTTLPGLLANPELAALDLVSVFERLSVYVEDDELRAQLSLGPDETARLVRALETLAERGD